MKTCFLCILRHPAFDRINNEDLEVLARVFDSTKHLGATDVGMTFRVPHFGTLGTAQYGDIKEYTLKPEGPQYMALSKT